MLMYPFEAESVAYVVCNHFGLDTSDYSFGYIANWSSNKELSELRNSMDTIRVTSSQLISDMTEKLQELRKNKDMEKEESEKVINSDDVIVKFTAEFDSEWEVIKITNMSQKAVGKLLNDMAVLDAEGWDGDYIAFLEQHGAEITSIYSSASSDDDAPEYYDYEYDMDADSPVTEWRKVVDERALFTRTDDAYAIYQYDHTGGDWGYEFMSLEFVENMGLTVDGKDYQMMYMSTLEPNETLDTLFSKFNIDRPEDFEGHSMSTSDVVIMKRDGEMKAYYVDDIGFKELSEFALQRANLLDISLEQNHSPVYMGTLEQAVEEKDAGAYLDSRELNIDCKNTIEQAIAEHYDGTSLNSNTANAVLKIVETYGVERVSFVLANTLHQRSADGRFSDRNKQWGASIEIPENIRQGVDLNKDYIVNSHPAVLNGFIDLVRHEIAARRIEGILGKKRVDITENTENYATEIDMNNHSDIQETQIAYQIGNQYFLIQTAQDGYDYTFYDENYRELDGGIYDDDTIPITKVIQNLLEEEGISIDDANVIDYEKLQMAIENIDEIHMQEINREQSESIITFYAAECMEFPDVGEIYENLTLDEAIQKYESIPAERINGIKGIGFDLEDGSDYEGKYALMHLGRVERESVEMVQHFKENPSIQKALDTLEKYCEKQTIYEDEKMKSDKQQDTNRKQKQHNIQLGLHR